MQARAGITMLWALALALAASSQAVQAQSTAPQPPPSQPAPAAPVTSTAAPASPAIPAASAPDIAASPAAAPPAAAAPATAPPAAAPPSSASQAACLLGEHAGVVEADASTSAALVCGALADRGASVATEPIGSAEAYGHGSAYRIALRRLGKLVVLHVAYESPVGQELRSRQLQLANIEEMTVAAPRMADALLHGKALAETAKVDNLVGEETRIQRKQSGETFFAIGILGFALPPDAWAGYGALLRFHYETTRLAISVDARIAGSSQNDGDAHLYGIAVGSRYFLSDADLGPYVGGGLGVLWVGLRKTVFEPQYGYDDYSERSGSGLAPFAEAGLELLRMHDSRLDLGLRVEIPLFQIEGDGHRSYAVPISLLASYSFD